MIPGFEDQLAGRSVGDEVAVEVTFPDEFPKAELAGKPATFAVQVKELEEPKPLALDELAKAQGLDGLKALEAAIRESIEREYAQFGRMRLKRALLDRLAERYRFEVPAGMVDLEFDAIWKQLQEELERSAGPEGAASPRTS